MTAGRPGSRQLMHLELLPSDQLAWMGPALATLAGAIASHRLALHADSLVALLLALLLADPLLGGLWSAVMQGEWRARWEASAPQEPVSPGLPHAVPGSLAHRLAEWLAHLGGGGRDGGDLGLLLPLTQVGFFLVASVAVAAVLGPSVVLLVVAGAALALLRGLLSGLGRDARWPEALFFFGVAWSVGYGTFGGLPLSPQPDAVLAALLAVAWCAAYYGYRALAAGGGLTGGLIALDAGQTLAVALLSGSGRPWQAGLAGLLLAAQMLGQPVVWRDGDRQSYLRGALPFMVAALVVSFV